MEAQARAEVRGGGVAALQNWPKSDPSDAKLLLQALALRSVALRVAVLHLQRGEAPQQRAQLLRPLRVRIRPASWPRGSEWSAVHGQ